MMDLLLLDAQIAFARKVIARYEEQNATDDPHYQELVETLNTLEQERNQSLVEAPSAINQHAPH
jgi:hypothetical protein